MEIQERTNKYNDELAANSLARRNIKEKRDAEVNENNDTQEVPEERTQRKKIQPKYNEYLSDSTDSTESRYKTPSRRSPKPRYRTPEERSPSRRSPNRRSGQRPTSTDRDSYRCNREKRDNENQPRLDKVADKLELRYGKQGESHRISKYGRTQ